MACSATLSGRKTAVYHYNYFHSNSANDLDCMIKCQICDQEILKSVLNCHMNQKHGIDNIFFKIFKGNFLPDASEVEIFIKVNESKVPEYQKFAENHGDEISIFKPIKFDDAGIFAGGKRKISMLSMLCNLGKQKNCLESLQEISIQLY